MSKLCLNPAGPADPCWSSRSWGGSGLLGGAVLLSRLCRGSECGGTCWIVSAISLERLSNSQNAEQA